METVFTILIILLPITLRLIGKRLEQAGQGQVLTEHPFMQQVQEPIVEKKQQPKPVKQDKQVVKSSMLVDNDQQTKDKDKIDPKKLIIYSEIMKPKYME